MAAISSSAEHRTSSVAGRCSVRGRCYQIIGRASLILDALHTLSASNATDNHEMKDCDKTGLVVKEVCPLKCWWRDSEIVYPRYDSFAYSFWRAQEFSLFEGKRSLLRRPVLDFGCGDGSFASVLFNRIDYGVDNDAEALSLAAKFGVHETLLQSSDSAIPLGDASVWSVFSNSVLEHLADLSVMLSEINRILKEDGVFMFTVPVVQFQQDLAKYFGLRESDRINTEYCHRNLLRLEQWRALLEDHGFSIMVLDQFQPDWFTFWFRMFRFLGNRGLGRIVPGIGTKVWESHKTRLVDMVHKSVNDTESGANIFVIAKKRYIQNH